MRKFSLFIAAAIFCSLFSHAQSSAITIPAGPVLINHVNVVNVKTKKIDADQTVLIDSGVIRAVGPIRFKLPGTTTVIDGTGKYLMPGLTDAHIHFFQSGGLYTRPDGLNLNAVYTYEKDQQWIKDNLNNLMARYLACGITTVMDVGGPFSNYEIRGKLDTTITAPTAFVTGPLISTYLPANLDKKDPPIIKVNTPEEARALVRRQLPYKPDFIKIWYIVLPGQKADSTLPMVKAAIEESHANGLKVCVHATEYQTARLAVTAGADILVHSVEDSILDKNMLQLLKTKKTVYIPTLIVGQNYARTFSQQFNFTQHDLTYADPFMLGTLMDIQHLGKKMPFDYKAIRSRFTIPSKDDSTMLNNLRLAEQAGILVVNGTDAGNIGTHHAASLYDEWLAMQKAGLSNWEILQSSTINAAKGFGKDDRYGSVEKGKVADLLLLNTDPTKDLNVPAAIQTVIHRGVPMTPEQLLPVTPESLVQQQLNAYNARNIDAFLAPYSDTCALYDIGGKLIMKGKEQMRQEYEKAFKNLPGLHCQLVNRMVHGNTVVDHERITGMDNKPIEAFAVYKIDKGKIVSVYFTE